MKLDAIEFACGCRAVPLDDGNVGWTLTHCSRHDKAVAFIEAAIRLFAIEAKKARDSKRGNAEVGRIVSYAYDGLAADGREALKELTGD